MPFVLSYAPSHLPVPEAARADAALDGDRDILARVDGASAAAAGPWTDAVVRSLITLKALTYGPTGGIVAAPTTSLPEQLGGDAQLGLPLLLAARRHPDPARADERRLLRRGAGLARLAAARGRGQPGADADHVWHRRRAAPDRMGGAWLPGYEGRRPVRIGNAAHGQFQLDVFGEVMDALHQAPARRARRRANPAGTCSRRCSNIWRQIWRKPDEGIWEVRGGSAALHLFQGDGLGRVRPGDQERGGVRAATARSIAGATCRRNPRGGLPPRTSTRARELRTVLRREAARRQPLLLPPVGFLPPDDPRMLGTVAAIESGLLRRRFVMRYDTENAGRAAAGRGRVPRLQLLAGRRLHPAEPRADAERCSSGC